MGEIDRQIEIKPIVAVPMERAISYSEIVVPWLLAIAQRGWAYSWLPYTRIDVARNQYAQHLLASDFTHLIMLDLDQDHPADVVEQLCRSVAEDPDNRLVVAGKYHRRGAPYDPLMFVVNDDTTKMVGIADWEPDSVLPVDVVGTGEIIVARAVFERLAWPWFKYEYPEPEIDPDGNILYRYPTEDVYFCRLCMQAGIQVWCDTRIQSDHLTIGRINETVYRSYRTAWSDDGTGGAEGEVVAVRRPATEKG